jgi:Domain of unknown function (DUF4365)
VSTKRRNQQHLTDEQGSRLLQSCLPHSWVLRPYRPDYGLDYSLELFKRVENSAGQKNTFETLGEHLFVQLKSTASTTVRTLKIFGRYNVEKKREALNKAELVGTLKVVGKSLESSELATIDRMGVGVPVLLVIADIASGCCYYVCLNDYIDKILVPRFGIHATSKSRSIDVPIANVLTPNADKYRALRWYGRRAKLYAAFQRFAFQNSNLETLNDERTIIEMARHFAARIAPYDFWDDTEIWEALGHYGQAVRHFLASGDATKLRLEPGVTEYERKRGDNEGTEARAADILRLWKLLSHLGSNYEDVCREWFLPTALRYLTGYANTKHHDSFTEKYARPNR